MRSYLPFLTVALLLGSWTPALAQQNAAGDSGGLVIVLDFQAVGTQADDAARFARRVGEALQAASRFTLPHHRVVDEEMERQRVAPGSCTSAECAARVGQGVGAGKAIVGRLMRIEGRLWLASAALVDVASAKIERSASITFDGELPALIGAGADDLAARLVRDSAAAGNSASGLARGNAALFPNRLVVNGEPAGDQFAFIPRRALEAVREAGLRVTHSGAANDYVAGASLSSDSDVAGKSWTGFIRKPNLELLRRRARELDLTAVVMVDAELFSRLGLYSFTVYVYSTPSDQIFSQSFSRVPAPELVLRDAITALAVVAMQRR